MFTILTNVLPAFAQLTPCAAEIQNKDLQLKAEAALFNAEPKNEVVTWEIPVRFTVCQKDDGTGWTIPITEAFLDTFLADMNNKLAGGVNIFHFFRCGPANYINSTQMYSGAVLPSNYSYIKGILNVYLYNQPGVAPSATYPWALQPNLVFLTQGNTNISNGSGFHELGHSLGLYHIFDPAAPYKVPVAPDQEDHPTIPGGRELVITVQEPPTSTKQFHNPNHATGGGDRVFDTPAGCSTGASRWPSSASIPGCIDNDPNTPCINFCLDNDPNTPCIAGCTWDLINCKYTGDYRDYNFDLITDPDDVLVKNYMSYTGTCRQEFTPGQIARADLYCNTTLNEYYQEDLCSSLNDKVEIEGTTAGLSRVRMRIEPTLYPDDYTLAIAGPDGSFNGKLPHPPTSTNFVKADVRRYKTGNLDILDDDWLYGLTTFDLLTISRHILGLEPLANGYKMLAADANKSNTITTFDIVEFRKLILGIYDKLPEYERPWRFVPEWVTQTTGGALQADFDGLNNDDPFSTFVPTPVSSEVSALVYTDPTWAFPMKGGGTRNGFDAVKLGNVIGGFPTELADECPGEVAIVVPNDAIAPDKYITIKVKGYGIQEIGAIQMGLHVSSDDFELIETSSTKLPDFSKDNNTGGLSQGADNLKMIWLKEDLTSHYITNGDNIFVFTLKTKTNIPNLSQALTLDDQVLETYVLGSNGACKSNVSLEFSINISNAFTDQASERNSEPDTEEIEQKLYCVPNPASDEATILFDANSLSEGEITIFDASGRQLQRQACLFDVGRNTVKIDGFSALPPGLLLIRVYNSNRYYTTTILKK